MPCGWALPSWPLALKRAGCAAGEEGFHEGARGRQDGAPGQADSYRRGRPGLTRLRRAICLHDSLNGGTAQTQPRQDQLADGDSITSQQVQRRQSRRERRRVGQPGRDAEYLSPFVAKRERVTKYVAEPVPDSGASDWRRRHGRIAGRLAVRARRRGDRRRRREHRLPQKAAAEPLTPEGRARRGPTSPG
jgi:hypothetical protein